MILHYNKIAKFCKSTCSTDFLIKGIKAGANAWPVEFSYNES